MKSRGKKNIRRRAQRPIPPYARDLLEIIPRRFRDDGCSHSPDSLFGFQFRWACRIHDWRGCSRCHPPGDLTYEYKVRSDEELRQNIRAVLPWRWRWVGYLYFWGVFIGGNFDAFDSCPWNEGEFCRHGMERPSWMTEGEEFEG